MAVNRCNGRGDLPLQGISQVVKAWSFGLHIVGSIPTSLAKRGTDGVQGVAVGLFVGGVIP